MKKLLTLAAAAMIFTTSFAHEGKDCAGKKCTKADMANCKKDKKACCKKDSKSTTVKAKEVKTTTVATKKA